MDGDGGQRPADRARRGPIPVLFTHYGDQWIRGSETLLLDLLRALDPGLIRPVVWCNGTEMADACRAAGYTTHHSDFAYFLDGSSPKLDAGQFSRLVRQARELCREHGIRVLHANSAAPTQWLVPAAFGARLPVLSHLHIDYLRRSRYVLLLHAATRVVGVSRQVLDGLLADGMSPDRTQVIYNGIDFARIKRSEVDLRSSLGIPGDAFVIGTAGSLIRRKGHDVLIRAFHTLPAEPTAPHLIIPSDGPEREALQALARSLGLTERVHLLGYTDDITRVYQAADLFALASRADAFGLVLAEAGHFGLAAATTFVGGVPEVVADGETGLLTPPDDVPAFSAVLARLAGDPALRATLGANARRRVGEMFSVELMARRFEATYAELAALPPRELGVANVKTMVKPLMRLAGGRPAPLPC